MENKLCFVQFIHPGLEHRPDDGSTKRWNAGKHRRKFIKQAGRYITEDGPREAQLVFWAEWEPESKALKRIKDPMPDGPRFIYEPYYVVPKSYRRLQNTDPFIFGEQFHYTGCQQRRHTGPTQLRYLTTGSVILFGSCLGGRFVLDTVFVVDHWIDHTRANHRKVLGQAVSQPYFDVTVRSWYKDPAETASADCSSQPDCGEDRPCASADEQNGLRLYFGATYDHPVQGTYSYFPCLPFQPGSKGFARPMIDLPSATNGKKNQGYKLTWPESLQDTKTLWDEVTAQVQRQCPRSGRLRRDARKSIARIRLQGLDWSPSIQRRPDSAKSTPNHGSSSGLLCHNTRQSARLALLALARRCRPWSGPDSSSKPSWDG
jgi:hypothetical protein